MATIAYYVLAGSSSILILAKSLFFLDVCGEKARDETREAGVRRAGALHLPINQWRFPVSVQNTIVKCVFVQFSLMEVRSVGLSILASFFFYFAVQALCN